jgi:hypothetical protein
MLWHVSAHAFVITVLRPGIPLISLADIAHIVEAWRHRIDWRRFRSRYPRAARALHYLASAPPAPASDAPTWTAVYRADVQGRPSGGSGHGTASTDRCHGCASAVWAIPCAWRSKRGRRAGAEAACSDELYCLDKVPQRHRQLTVQSTNNQRLIRTPFRSEV